jgi:hypothetical protein
VSIRPVRKGGFYGWGRGGLGDKGKLMDVVPRSSLIRCEKWDKGGGRSLGRAGGPVAWFSWPDLIYLTGTIGEKEI